MRHVERLPVLSALCAPRLKNRTRLPGQTPINFNITTTSQTISPSSSFPRSLPHHAERLQPIRRERQHKSISDNAVIKIVLNGTNAGSAANGLVVDNAGPTVIKGLVIHGFGAAGVSIAGRRATISGNFIGTNTTAFSAVPNNTGVSITGDRTLSVAAASERATSSRNNADGIDVSGNGATSNSILQNYIGTTKSGAAALANGSNGVDITGGFALIGGSGDGNVISGNEGFGIHVDTPTVGTKIRANRIGTDAAGSGALGNGGSGIFCADTSDLVIGTGTSATRNVIAANGLDGLLMIRCSNSTIAGNYIGTDFTGSVDLGNTGAGVNVIDGTGVTIGGATLGTGNVISGNTSAGVDLQGPGVTVQGNRIGTSATGSSDLGNDKHEIAILAGGSNTIGGTGAAGNTVLFNDIGILADTGSNTITGNAVETNDRVGIWLEGDSNTVGGNVVIGNGSTGIMVSAGGKGNRITANQMAANGGLGIDLGSAGVTANDSGDGDTGDNNQQNFPILSNAVRMANGVTIVSGSINSLPSTQFKIEFFIVSADASGHGEGFIFLGSTTVTTNSSGNKSISLATAQLSPGQQVTATATNTTTGDTSEFSANVTVVAAP